MTTTTTEQSGGYIEFRIDQCPVCKSVIRMSSDDPHFDMGFLAEKVCKCDPDHEKKNENWTGMD